MKFNILGCMRECKAMGNNQNMLESPHSQSNSNSKPPVSPISMSNVNLQPKVESLDCDFYYDCGCPWSYFSMVAIQTVCKEMNIDCKFKLFPCRINTMMDKPMVRKDFLNEKKKMSKDDIALVQETILDAGKKLCLDIMFMEGIVCDTINSHRLIDYCIKDKSFSNQQIIDLLQRINDGWWLHREDISDKQQLASYANEILGIDKDKILNYLETVDDQKAMIELCESNLIDADDVPLFTFKNGTHILSTERVMNVKSARSVLSFCLKKKNDNHSNVHNIVDLIDEDPVKTVIDDYLLHFRRIFNPFTSRDEQVKPIENNKRRFMEKMMSQKHISAAPTGCKSRPKLNAFTQHSSQNIAVSLEKKLEFIRMNLPPNMAIHTPFGLRPICYADFTASGRPLLMIEEYIKQVITPMFANTHTESSATGLQTTHFREEARQIILQYLNADPALYSLIFYGSGVTACISKLINLLGLWYPDRLKKYMKEIPIVDTPLILISSCEHHSNDLMWRNTIGQVQVIEQDETGDLDKDQLLSILTENKRKYGSNRQVICSFTAGSNVTGLKTNPYPVASMVHSFGGIVCFDFAGAGPYVEIHTNGIENIENSYLDAVFLSPHKFVGGPGSPGLLVIRKELFKVDTTIAPTVPGGGTVKMVSRDVAVYETDITVREEAGTPAIIESIRCGIAVHVQSLIGIQNIERIEGNYAMRAVKRLKAHKNIWIMGDDKSNIHTHNRLSITSFNIYCTPYNEKHAGDLDIQRMIHPHFVASLLNDLYGIQARSGCSCAGPLAFDLFARMGEGYKKAVVELAENGFHAIKPGWCRVNFHYFIDEEEFEFIIKAIEQIAEFGYKLLPLYALCLRTGQYWFNNNTFDRFDGVRTISEITFAQEGPVWLENGRINMTRAEILKSALEIYKEAATTTRAMLHRWRDIRRLDTPFPDELQKFRWFVLSSEVLEFLDITKDELEAARCTVKARDSFQNPAIVAYPKHDRAKPMSTFNRPRG